MMTHTRKVKISHINQCQRILGQTNGWFLCNPTHNTEEYYVEVGFENVSDFVRFEEEMNRVELVVVEKVRKINSLTKILNRFKLLIRS